MTKAAGRVAAAVLLVALVPGFLLMPGSARAWWNDDWSIRKKIVIDMSPEGAGITDQIGPAAPVLVRLHSGNFRFSAAKDDGSDIRFIAADDMTPLKYSIESYDSLLGEAFIWVNVPNLAPGSRSEFWLYYGNRKAGSGADPKGVYDADTLMVYHFNERGSPPQDASVWGHNAQGAGVPAEGALIGRGLRFDGTATVPLPAAPPLATPDGGTLTWSTWFNMAAAAPGATIYSRREGNSGLVVGLDNGVPFVEVTSAGSVQRSPPGPPVGPGGWHHLAVIADGTAATIYLDGNPYGSLAVALPAMTTAALLGGDAPAGSPPAPAASPPAPGDSPSAPAAPGDAPVPPDAAPPAAAGAALANFVGDIDEFELAKTARPPGFVKFAAVSQGPDPSKLISFGADEETSSWFSGGYFGVIVRSVTIDGWMVIGLLVMMAAVSWMVVLNKVSLLNRQSRANTRFLKKVRPDGASLTLPGRGSFNDTDNLGIEKLVSDNRIVRNSSLCRLYAIGLSGIRSRVLRADAENILSPQAIAAIRATLEGGLIKEVQRLNRRMVILTIAISGGPFLGLLGTVIGVMITFAAIAATGDVNINAIAPGIAAALVATVAGLAVAIPALFAYNYLITRIRDLTTDMQIFVDELITFMAEIYQDRAPGTPQSSAYPKAAE